MLRWLRRRFGGRARGNLLRARLAVPTLARHRDLCEALGLLPSAARSDPAAAYAALASAPDEALAAVGRAALAAVCPGAEADRVAGVLDGLPPAQAGAAVRKLAALFLQECDGHTATAAARVALAEEWGASPKGGAGSMERASATLPLLEWHCLWHELPLADALTHGALGAIAGELDEQERAFHGQMGSFLGAPAAHA